MFKGIKKFYDELYQEKKRIEYQKEFEKRRKDFLHKYILFFLNPYKNTRHEVVRKILPSGKRILDIGCWDGESTAFYGSFQKFEEVYGIEILDLAGSKAQERGIKVSICDINTDPLPFPENFFDAVTFIAVIEHLIDPFHILKEIQRVLRSEGVLIIGTANVASFSNRIRILFGRRPRTSYDIGWDGGHLLYFTPKDLKELLSDYDFKVVGRYATGNLQWLRKFLFPLTGEYLFKCVLKK